MIVEIQVVPSPHGRGEERYYYVDRALDVIKASGLHYEVGALGTTIEGDAERLWPLLRQVHRAALEHGAETCLTFIKLSERASGGVTMDELTAKHRPAG